MSSTLSVTSGHCQRPGRSRSSMTESASPDSTSSDSHSSDPDTQLSSLSWSQAHGSAGTKPAVGMDIDATSHSHMMDLDSDKSLDRGIHDLQVFNALQSYNFNIDDLVTPTNLKPDMLLLEEIIKDGAFDPVSSSVPAFSSYPSRSTSFGDLLVPPPIQESQPETQPLLGCIDPSSTQATPHPSFSTAPQSSTTPHVASTFKEEPTGILTLSPNPQALDDIYLKLESSSNPYQSVPYDPSPPATVSPHVACPPKDVCLGLPIFFPSVPSAGTKSRVETQIKLTFELGISVSHSSMLSPSFPPIRQSPGASSSQPSSSSSSGSNSPSASPAIGSRELSPAAENTSRPPTHNRVGTYKFLRLPPGTATKRRVTSSATGKRESKACEVDPQDTLQMVADVRCCSSPSALVQSCASCRSREAKRTARKLAARVRPLQNARKPKSKGIGKKSKRVKDQDHEEEDLDEEEELEEPNVDGSILQFNCPEVLDFSGGAVVLPMRITCYCRHHKEKIGFNIVFTLQDNAGRVVGRGTTPPILITDDHKSTNAVSKLPPMHPLRHALTPPTPPPAAPSPPSSTEEPHPSSTYEQGGCAPTRRHDVEFGARKRRPKPYDGRPANRTAGLGPGIEGRQGIVLALHPAHIRAQASVRSTIPANVTSFGPSVEFSTSLSSRLNTSPGTTRSSTPSYLDMSHISSLHSVNGSSDVSLPTMGSGTAASYPSPGIAGISPSSTVPSLASSLSSSSRSPSDIQTTQHFGAPSNFPTYPQEHQAALNVHSFPIYPSPPFTERLLQPRIHRLIPSSGPTTGGIEITVLGSNFHPSLPLECIFGGATASSTHRWSDNTLVCVLPPRATPGLVSVEFKNVKREGGQDDGSACLFTYVDESDRQLMELALQVVGLKMTGKIEEARNVAMRIVGNTNAQSPAMTAGELSHINTVSETSFVHHAFLGSLGSMDLETLIIKLLTLLDIPSEDGMGTLSSTCQPIDHQNATGQTLLHLAVFLALPALASCLIGRSINIDARNGNGLTALHFAAVTGWKEGLEILLASGADVTAVDLMGLTPTQRARDGKFKELEALLEVWLLEDLSEGESGDEGDDEAWHSDSGESDGGRSDRSLQPWSDAPPQYMAHSHIAPSRHPDSSQDELSEPGENPIKSTTEPQVTQVDGPQVSRGETVKEKPALDNKHDTFVERLQRTLPQGILPNVQIPGFPQLQLTDMLAAPWGALPQIPVFPVFVPIPNFPNLPHWPGFPWADALSGEKKDNTTDEGTAGGKQQQPPLAMFWTAYDSLANSAWRAHWTALQNASDPAAELPPYAPRSENTQNNQVESKTPTPVPAPLDEASPNSEMEDSRGASTSRPPVAKVTRRVGYSTVKIPETEVDSYHYRPKKLVNKQDRMLVLFWIPMLFLGLAYAVYTTLPVALAGISRATKRMLPQPLQRDQIQV